MDTKKIITPVEKIEVELKSFITGRDKRMIRNVYLKNTQFEVEGMKTKNSKVDMEKITNGAEDTALSIVVISVNGKKEKILDTLLAMRSKDFDFVVKEVNKITQDDDFLEPLKTPKVIIGQAN